MEEPLEIPIMNDLTLVLGSISQVVLPLQIIITIILILKPLIYNFSIKEIFFHSIIYF